MLLQIIFILIYELTNIVDDQTNRNDELKVECNKNSTNVYFHLSFIYNNITNTSTLT